MTATDMTTSRKSSKPRFLTPEGLIYISAPLFGFWARGFLSRFAAPTHGIRVGMLNPLLSLSKVSDYTENPLVGHQRTFQTLPVGGPRQWYKCESVSWRP